MKFRLPLVLSVLGFVLTFSAAARAAETEERVAAAFALVFGRAPDSAELARWSAPAAESVSAVVARLRGELTAGSTAAATARKAFTDAFGRAPKAGEAAGTATYLELMQGHVRQLGAQPEEYAAVLNRAYHLVISRDVYPEEIDYWKKQDPLPYALVVACLEDWARRNQPGLMVTGGTATASVNSHYLSTARLSPAVAAEARGVAGLVPVGGADARATAGRHVIAVGAGKLVSSGRIHFVAVGASDLVR